MAILTVDSLLGCTSIPQFFQGTSDGANPTKTIFHVSTAPTSWTKDTTHNNKALRIIGGAENTILSPGGSDPFTNVFSSRSHSSGSSGPTATSTSLTSETIPVSPSTTGNVLYASNSNSSTNGLTASVSVSLAQLPPHAHQGVQRWGGGAISSPTAPTVAVGLPTLIAATGGPTGGGGGHTHGTTFPHTHPISVSPHTHTLSTVGHTHPTSSFPIDFRILYVDVIIATKN
jgi:hypothetical protein